VLMRGASRMEKRLGGGNAARPRVSWAVASCVCALMFAGAAGGCAVAQTVPPKPRPIGEVVREESGEVVSVRDTNIDLRTGKARALQTRTPRIPVGPVALGLPVTIGGEKRVEIPGEEITVRVRGGQLIVVVQELSSPPFAPGERVRVLHGRRDEATGQSRIKIERE
jgi:hypothetical protein